MTIFTESNYTYPYHNLKFPGQHSEEKILFVTREAKIMRNLRYAGVLGGAILLFIFTSSALTFLKEIHLLSPLVSLLSPITLILPITLGLIGLWWVNQLWKKSVFIITTRRLTKFIHTTPWNRYQLSLGLDKIVDTGAYQKGMIQSLFKLGYFVARSSAGNIKNFKIINIAFAEDLHNYVNKLLFTFNKEKEKLDQFRPFIPNLKGEARDHYVANTTPEYAKEHLKRRGDSM